MASIQHHFLSAVVPEAGAPHVYRVEVKGDSTIASVVGAKRTVEPGASETFSRQLFVGPKIQSQLGELHERLKLTVDYGWLTILSQPMFWVLSFIYDYVGNWGVAIIVVNLIAIVSSGAVGKGDILLESAGSPSVAGFLVVSASDSDARATSGLGPAQAAKEDGIVNFEFSEEQYEFLEQVDRFLEENYDPEVMDPSRENMSQLVDTPKRRAFCIFEFIYFARPDSTFFGHNVYLTRKAHGRRLAEESPVDADLVMPFPDSGTYSALGYSEASGIPFETGMIRNHYVGRTFIQPTQSMRDFGVRIKLNPIRELLKGKDIIIIEDSIIRGTTAKTRVKTLKELGVNRVHMRVAGPPFIPSGRTSSDPTTVNHAPFGIRAITRDSARVLSRTGSSNRRFENRGCPRSYSRRVELEMSLVSPVWFVMGPIVVEPTAIIRESYLPRACASPDTDGDANGPRSGHPPGED